MYYLELGLPTLHPPPDRRCSEFLPRQLDLLDHRIQFGVPDRKSTLRRLRQRDQQTIRKRDTYTGIRCLRASALIVPGERRGGPHRVTTRHDGGGKEGQAKQNTPQRPTQACHIIFDNSIIRPRSRACLTTLRTPVKGHYFKRVRLTNEQPIRAKSE